VANVNEGLFQGFTGTPMGTWDDATSGATGMFDYADIAVNYVNRPGMDMYRDSDSGVPWLHDPSNGFFLSYDDPASLALKKEYVLTNDLGGVMIWEMSSDLEDQLLNAVVPDMPPPTVPALNPGGLGLLATLLGWAATRRLLRGRESLLGSREKNASG
ncbi:MAG: IPTL-CTERM sorting domain-containing protein, partial [Myxococcales bacterium]